MTITSFHPPRRTLMGPGPSDVSERVLQAMARPTVGSALVRPAAEKPNIVMLFVDGAPNTVTGSS